MAELKRGDFCPLIKEDCKQLECVWYTMLRGTDSNTGKEVDDYMCAISSLPMLLVENSNQQRGTGAAVESFRNEMVKGNIETAKLLKEGWDR